jgi:hypothetical protein
VIVPCQGEALPDVRAVPRFLDCGVLHWKRAKRESTCILSVGGRPFAVETASLPAGVTVQSQTASADNTVHEMVMSVDPEKCGVWEAQAAFFAVDETGMKTPVEIRMRAYVMNPTRSD